MCTTGNLPEPPKIEVLDEWEGIPIVIEFLGVDESHLADLQCLFTGPDEQVVFSHAFGGKDALVLISTFGKRTFEKLIDFWSKRGTAPKTKLKIDKSSFTLQGFTQPEIEALMASPNFAKTIRLIRKK